MFLYEYQAKKILKEERIPVPEGVLIGDATSLKEILKIIDKHEYVVKAQVLSGDRNVHGGIFFVSGKNQIESCIRKMFKKKISTLQNNYIGEKVNKILIEKRIDYEKYIYFSILYDRKNQCIFLIISSNNIDNIELAAELDPSLIVKIPIDYEMGKKEDYIAEKLSFFCNDLLLFKIVSKLYKLFIKHDLTLLEINPLAKLKNGEWICLDAKFNMDDSSFYRQDLIKLDKKDLLWKRNFIKMDGDIACIANGAGLAMATMDMIVEKGKHISSFLDVGSLSQEELESALKFIFIDRNNRIILINIFGGIVDCKNIAKAVVKFIKIIKKNTSLFIRFKGNGAQDAYKILDRHSVKYLKEYNLARMINKL